MTKIPQNRQGATRTAANAALFAMHDNPGFLRDAVSNALNLRRAIIVSDDSGFMPTVPASQRIGFADAALDRAPVEPDAVIAKLKPMAAKPASGLIVDMQWAIANMEAITSLERWGGVAERLARECGRPVISAYDQDLVIEEQMQAAFRVHSQFLAPSGVHPNPYWIPATLLETAALDEQLAFMLGRVVPDYEGLHGRRKGGEMLARGATPSWLAKTKPALGANAASARWHIHCFGQLRVFIGGRSIEWRIPGSTPKKNRTLFAYLLQCGDKGAHAEQISELLWPDEPSESVKRARLHHTVAMLRKTLGLPSSIARAGDYYRLNAPPGSVLDIDTFEQLCRRGLALFKKGELDSAMRVYLAADQLYAGDLFEDLPRDYVESENENWCLPRRMWLREMALKLQNDFTSLLMRMGRTREALEHCLKALALDPASESANAEAMRIFSVQGREEAIHRQYRQYMQALAAAGETESPELRAHYRELTAPRRASN